MNENESHLPSVIELGGMTSTSADRKIQASKPRVTSGVEVNTGYYGSEGVELSFSVRVKVPCERDAQYLRNKLWACLSDSIESEVQG